MPGLLLGESQEAYEARRATQVDDVWLRTFKEGETKIRPFTPVSGFVRARFHYDPIHKKTFACPVDFGMDYCVGCASDNERMRSRAARYIMQAFDKDGNLRLYQLPVGVRNLFQSREQRKGSITDRDITVIRSGTDKDNTAYELEDSQPYPLKPLPDDFEPFNIHQVLGDGYQIAAQLNGVEVRDEDIERAAQRHSTVAEIAQAGAAAAQKSQAAWAATGEENQDTEISKEFDRQMQEAHDEAQASAPPAETPKAEEQAVSEKTLDKPVFTEPVAGLDIDNMDNTEMKAWLTEHGIAYPEKVLRGQLIKAIKAAVADTATV